MSLPSRSKVSLRLSVCCHTQTASALAFQPAQAPYSGWKSSGNWFSSSHYATNGHQHLLPAPLAPSLREGLKAWLALVAFLAHHSRFAAALAITVALWAEGTCRKRARDLNGHLPTPAQQCCCRTGEQSTTPSLQQQPSNRLRSQHRAETPGLAVTAASASPADAGDLEKINPSRH